MSQIQNPSHDTAPGADLIPRGLIVAVCALVLAILAIVTFARVTDQPLSATPPPGEVVKTRDLVLSGDMSGAATVTATDGTLIANLTPEQGGFISGVCGC